MGADLGSAFVGGGFALGGAALGVGGTAFLEARRERSTAKRERDAALSAILTSTIDLVQAQQVVRAAYLTNTRTRHVMRVVATVLVELAATAPPEHEFTWTHLSNIRNTYPLLDRLVQMSGELDERQRRAALDVLTVIAPRATAFYAAITQPAIRRDTARQPQIEALAGAVSELLAIVGGKHAEYQRAQREVDIAAAAFREVID